MGRGTWVLQGNQEDGGRLGGLGKFGGGTERVLRNPHTHTHFKFSQRIALGLPTKSTPFPSPPFVSREDEAALLVLLGAKKS